MSERRGVRGLVLCVLPGIDRAGAVTVSPPARTLTVADICQSVREMVNKIQLKFKEKMFPV